MPYPGPVEGLAGTERIRDRYELTDLVAHVGAVTLWRAWDDRLLRTVGLRAVDASDLRADSLHDAAIAAAHITDRRFANVLDVLGPEPEGQLIVITEWIPGLSLTELLVDRMTPQAAAATVEQVARAIASAHAQGVTHGRLRPGCVTVAVNGAVRLRGHGVDASLYGISPEDLDPVAADIYGLGSLLYACLTARWPGTDEVGLPSAPVIRGRSAMPSRLVADVPQSLEAIIRRCWADEYATAQDVADDLHTAAFHLLEPPERHRWSRRRTAVAALAAVALLVAAAGVTGVAETTRRPSQPTPEAPRARGPATIAATVGENESRLPLISARDYDPYGIDGEHPDEVAYALDRDALTAWTTLTYYDPDLGGKPGVGLRFDLGAPRPVTSISLGLVGANSDLTVYMGNAKTAQPERYRTFAAVTGAGSRILLRAPRPVSGRYIVIWFTRLPWVEGGYRGGVRSIAVRSG